MKLMYSLLASLLMLSLAECGGTETSTAVKEEKQEEAKLLNRKEFEQMYTDPKKYKGSKVEFYAKVFVEPEKDEEGTYLQVYANNNDERNTIIGYEDPDFDVKVDDIILVKGTVEDVFEGENALGGTVTAPMIQAESIQQSDYVTAFSPPKKTIEVSKEVDQHGYIIKLNKIELADTESRVYLTVTNKTKATISFFSFDAKAVAGSKQLETQDNYEAAYPEIPSDILPGVQSEGIIAFPELPEKGNVKILFEGSSDNYELEFEPFVFDVEY
ncbi:DUF4352 domain-containing protein [Mesobacillus foraminis]|uniref:DUF4352 domain-containing protein n=1 Tax=Mesobacillus foraminis TaxID=279826 RepID=UPI0039A2A073